MDTGKHKFTPEVLDLAHREQYAGWGRDAYRHDGTAARVVLDRNVDIGKVPLRHCVSMAGTGRIGYASATSTPASSR
jgi:hypothetical protein